MSAAGYNANPKRQQEKNDLNDDIVALFFGAPQQTSSFNVGSGSGSALPESASSTPQYTNHRKRRASNAASAADHEDILQQASSNTKRHSQSMEQQPLTKDNITAHEILASQNLTSPYQGVDKLQQRIWSATFRYKQITYEIGKFVKEGDAAEAYDFFLQTICLLLNKEGKTSAAKYIKQHYKHNFFHLLNPIPDSTIPSQDIDLDIRTVLQRFTQRNQPSLRFQL